MAGIYKRTFPDGTAVAEATEQTLAWIRAAEDDDPAGCGDSDEVTFGPDIIQSAPHPDVQTPEATQQEAGVFTVRVVTGLTEDPAAVAAMKAAATNQTAEADQVIGRLAELPPEKIAALGALLDRLE